MPAPKSAHEKIALEFAQALANGEFTSAEALLAEIPSPNLAQNYAEMIHYAEEPIDQVEVILEMQAWPAKREHDIGWVYVAMSGLGYSEAVTVIVSDINNSLKITSIEWGRP